MSGSDFLFDSAEEDDNGADSPLGVGLDARESSRGARAAKCNQPRGTDEAGAKRAQGRGEAARTRTAGEQLERVDGAGGAGRRGGLVLREMKRGKELHCRGCGCMARPMNATSDEWKEIVSPCAWAVACVSVQLCEHAAE
eukprot:5935613-Pleurochrysis_carterae.AAC.1